METQAPAQVRVERGGCGNSGPGTERVYRFVPTDLWPERAGGLVPVVSAGPFERRGTQERRSDRPEAGGPGTGAQSAALPERLPMGRALDEKAALGVVRRGAQ